MLLAIRGGAFFDFWPQVTSVVSLNRGLTGRFEVTASNDLGCWFEVAASNDLGGRFEVAALNGLKWAWWSYHPSNWGKLRFSCNFWPRMASEDGSEDLAEQVLNAVQTSKKASFHDFLAPQIAQISWRPRRPRRMVSHTLFYPHPLGEVTCKVSASYDDWFGRA